MTPDGPPGSGTFSLEGRAAPGLYLVGWLGTIAGFGTLFVSTLSGGGGAAVGLLTVAALLLSVGLVAAAGAQALQRQRGPVSGGGPASEAVVDAEALAGAVADADIPAHAEAPARDDLSLPATATPAGARYAGPSPFLVFAASLPISVLVVAALAIPVFAFGLEADSEVAILGSILLSTLLYVGLVRLLVVGTGSLSWAEMGLGAPDRAALRELAAGAIPAVPLVIVTALLGAVLVAIIGVEPPSILQPAGDLPTLALQLVAAAIVAPIGEEVFFRGFATTAWVRSFGSRPGIIRAALFFAFVHVLTIGGASFGDALGAALIAFVSRIPIAYGLGWVFVRRRSLYASLGLHGAYNGILVVLAAVAARWVGF